MKKTLKRARRLALARNWIKTYPGTHLVKGYSKKFAVNKLCAVKELRMIGVEISEAYQNQLTDSMATLSKQRQWSKQEQEDRLNASSELESDDHFGMIVGYTSGGFAYGISHAEMNEMDKET